MKFVKFLQGFMYDDISGGIASPLEFGCNTQMIFAKISVKVTDQKMGRAKIVNRKVGIFSVQEVSVLPVNV